MHTITYITENGTQIARTVSETPLGGAIPPILFDDKFWSPISHTKATAPNGDTAVYATVKVTDSFRKFKDVPRDNEHCIPPELDISDGARLFF